MFIREVFKKSKGKNYTQHQLIESIRTPAGPRQRLVLNLGTINIAKEKWKDLANLIESILNNQERLFTIHPIGGNNNFVKPLSIKTYVFLKMKIAQFR